jgi:membrane-associated phospholipid phosphatase
VHFVATIVAPVLAAADWEHDLVHAIGCGMSSSFWDTVLLTLQRTVVGVPAMLVGIGLLWHGDRRVGLRTFMTALVAYGICMGIASLAWNVHYRARPGRAAEHVLKTPAEIATCAQHPAAVVVRKHVSRRSGMPSRHALSSGVFALAMLLASRVLGMVACIYALLVALARVYSGVHWPSDVLVGLAIGGLVAFVIWRLTPAVFGLIGRRDWVLAPEPGGDLAGDEGPPRASV